MNIQNASQEAQRSWQGQSISSVRYPAVGPDYVWHCHILEHEDNEMMCRQLVTL